MRSHKKNLSKSIGENWRASSTCIAQNPKKKLTSCLASQMERGNFYQTNATTTTTLLSFICMAIYVVTVLQKL